MATNTPASGTVTPTASSHPPRSLAEWFRTTGQFIAALVITVGVLAWLLFAPTPPPPEPAPRRSTLQDSVEVAGPMLISIKPGTALETKLQSVIAGKASLAEPLFTVTGRVVASMRSGSKNGLDDLQFDSPEVASAYTDWQKAKADVAFTRTQLAGVKELATTKVEAQKKVVDRLTKLVEVGTDSPKDLAAEQTNLLQYQNQGRKEIHEAESAYLIAQRNEVAFARQLQQAGLDPELLRLATVDKDIVIAEVPEGRMTQVQVALSCEARFFGIPGKVFEGKVNRVLPALSKDRRTLRVLFVIDDPNDLLRPGMFAEIGLGTDPREAILIPTEAILHIGRFDYLLVQEEGTKWRAVAVKVGELHGDRVEILDSSLAGRRVLTKGTILLKPPVVLSLQVSAKNGGER